MFKNNKNKLWAHVSHIQRNPTVHCADSQDAASKKWKLKSKQRELGNSSAPGSGQRLSLPQVMFNSLVQCPTANAGFCREPLTWRKYCMSERDQYLSLFSIWCCKNFKSSSNHIGFRYLHLQKQFSFFFGNELVLSHTHEIYRFHCIANTPFFCRFIIKDSHTNNHPFSLRNLVHLSLHFTSSKTFFVVFVGFVSVAKEIYFGVKGVFLPCWDNSSCSTIISHKCPKSAQLCLNYTRFFINSHEWWQMTLQASFLE